MSFELKKVDIPGLGEVDIGLDWILVDAYENVDAEIKRLALSTSARWVKRIEVDDEDFSGSGNVCLSFVSSNQSKKAPIAGAFMLKEAIVEEQDFIVLLQLSDSIFWLVGFTNGLPVFGVDSKSAEFVGDETDVFYILRDFLVAFKSGISGIPVYTNCSEKLEILPSEYRVEPRNFNLEMLGKMLRKGALNRARFKKYSSLPIYKIIFGLGFLVLVSSFGAYYYLSSNDDSERLKRQRQQAEIQRKEQLAMSIDAAINNNPPANVAAKAYLEAINDVPIHLAGWDLESISCISANCSLYYKAGDFATWNSYMQGKPAGWSNPNITGNISEIYQDLAVEFPEVKRRTVESLDGENGFLMYFGNLAQVAQQIGIQFNLNSMPAFVNGESERWIPKKGTYSVAGEADYLSSLSERMTDSFGVGSIELKKSQGLAFNFIMEGEFYVKSDQ